MGTIITMWLRFNPADDALFLDIDGTLLDIASTARDVQVPPGLVDDLTRLYDKLDGALAFISGRMIHEIDTLFAPLRLPGAGAHGAEWRLTKNGDIESSPPLPCRLRDDIAAAFQGQKGILVEDKITNVAVHYRLAPHREEFIAAKLGRLIHAAGEDLRLLHGRKVFEIGTGLHNKGSAIERLLALAPFKNRRPVFLGDDTTDIAAIGACLRFGGIAARVGKGEPNQKCAFASPAHVRIWLAKMAREPGAASLSKQA